MDPADRDHIYKMMKRFGGYSEKTLANAIREATDGAGFALALVEVYNLADGMGRERLRQQFTDVFAVFEMPEADRLTHLHDAFPEIFKKFRAMKVVA